MKYNLKNNLCLLLCLFVLFIPLQGCGTILYPERIGQGDTGKIDTSVAVMDGLLCLLFIIPGVVAFIIDFENGTIYEPQGLFSEDSKERAVTLMFLDCNQNLVHPPILVEMEDGKLIMDDYQDLLAKSHFVQLTQENRSIALVDLHKKKIVKDT